MFKVFLIPSIPLIILLIQKNYGFTFFCTLLAYQHYTFMKNSNLISKSYFYIYSFKFPPLVPYYLELEKKEVLITTLLTISGWIPSVIYSIILVKNHYKD